MSWIRDDLFAGNSSISEALLLLVNLGVLAGAGWFNFILSGTRSMLREGPIFCVALFCVVQVLLIIPIVWMVALALIYFF